MGTSKVTSVSGGAGKCLGGQENEHKEIVIRMPRSQGVLITCDEPRQFRVEVLGEAQSSIQEELCVIVTIQHPLVRVSKLFVGQKRCQSSSGVSLVK